MAHVRRLENKIALITGGSRGIGAAIARAFAREGARVVLHGMKQRRAGNIITLSSAAARRPHPQSPVPYAAAKAGIQMLTQHLASQVGPFGIRVNCLAPETVLTERNRERIPEDMQRRLIDMHPVKRLGTPEDVASAAVFLASEESAWI